MLEKSERQFEELYELCAKSQDYSSFFFVDYNVIEVYIRVRTDANRPYTARQNQVYSWTTNMRSVPLFLLVGRVRFPGTNGPGNYRWGQLAGPGDRAS
jgi:hypothetical protein